MIREFSEIELKKLRDGLKVITDQNYPLHLQLREQLILISKALEALNGYMTEHPFADQHSEIDYYKYILPQFKALQIYCSEKYSLLSGRPLTGDKALRKYYLDDLQYIERYFLRHQFQQEYFRLDMNELDSVAFVKGCGHENGMPPILDSFQVLDTPPMSYLFAKFLAYDRLREDILCWVRELETVALAPVAGTVMAEKSKLQKAFKWTGEKINLIEMVHGLYVRKQVNHGKIGIGEFFEAIGAFFGIDLGIPKRGFDDIKLRKKLSKTHFIDSMRDELLRKMDLEDAYDPEKLAEKRLRF